MRRFIAKAAELVHGNSKHAWKILAVMIVLSVPGLFLVRGNFGIKVWFRQNDQVLKEFENFQRNFESDDNIFLSVEGKDDILSARSLGDIRALSERIWKIPDVRRVSSITNFPEVVSSGEGVAVRSFLDHADDNQSILERIERYPFLTGYLVGRDSKSTLLNIQLRSSLSRDLDYDPIFKGLESVLAPYRQKGYAFSLMGSATLLHEFQRVALRDFVTIFPFVILLIALVTVWIFRSVEVALIQFVPVFVTLLSLAALCGYAHIELNNISTMFPSMLLIITLSNSIHFIAGYLKNLESDRPGMRSLEINLAPTFLSSVTTSVGFFSMMGSDIGPLRQIGLLCGIGCLVGWILSALVILSYLDLRRSSLRQSSPNSNWNLLKPRTHARIVTRFPWIIVAGAVAATIAVAPFSKNINMNSNPVNYFSKKAEVTRANQNILKAYGGLDGVDIVLKADQRQGVFEPEFLAKTEKLQRWLESMDKVNRTISITDFLKPLNQAIHHGEKQFFRIPDRRETVKEEFARYNLLLPPGQDFYNLVSTDLSMAHVVVFWSEQETEASLSKCALIENEIKALGLNGEVTGREFMYDGLNRYIVSSLLSSMSISVLFVSVMLTLILGSLLMGVLTVVPHLIPLIFGPALFVLVKSPVDIGAVLVASVCFTLSVDDTIHILLEVKRRAAQFKNIEDLLCETIETKGTSVVGSTVILIGGLALFYLSSFMPNRNFGVMSSSLFMIAIILDLFLLPSLFVILASATAWSGLSARRAASRMGVENSPGPSQACRST